MAKKFSIFLCVLMLSGCFGPSYTKRVLNYDDDGAVSHADKYNCHLASSDHWITDKTEKQQWSVLYPVLSVITIGVVPAVDFLTYSFANPKNSKKCKYIGKDEDFFAPVFYTMNTSKAISGTSIEIKGRNLDQNPQVFFNGIKAKISQISEERLSVIVPNSNSNKAEVYVKTSSGRTKSKPFSIIPARSPLLSVSGLDFTGENGGKVLMADSSGIISFDIANAKDAGKAFNIEAYLKIENKKGKIESLDFPKKFRIGDIPPGTSAHIEIPLNAGLYLPDAKADFSIGFKEANDFEPDPLKISFKTVKIEKPDLKLADIAIDDKLYPSEKKLSVGNGNSIVEPGETIEVSIELFNAGTGKTKETAVSIVSSDKNIDFKTNSVFDLGNVPSGESRKITAAFSISKRYQGKEELPVKMIISDARNIFSKEIPLGIKVNRTYPKIEGVNVQGIYIPPSKPEYNANDLAKIPQARRQKPDAVAVVMGVRQYSDIDVPLVNYALNDAQAVKDYLEKAMGYDPKNIIYMPNPTHGDFMRVFGKEGDPRGQLASYITRGKSEVFVYYSGHGAPDINTRKAYLVPADASPSFISLNGYSLETLYKNLAMLPAKKITVVTDACFSGAFNSGTLLKNASPLAIEPASAGYEKLNIFSSSKGTEISSWYTEKKHGLYTYFFLKGLQGDADSDGNKIITAEELEDYLEEKVPALALRLYNRRQNPGFSGRKNDKIAEYKGK